jgi:putative hydrolase of the HAD superfamily
VKEENQIKTVIFDLGNVLIPFDWQRGYRALAEVSPFQPEEIRLRLKEMGIFDPMERGRLEPREAARQVGKALGFDVSFERFRELWSSIFLPETIVPESLLEKLRAAHRVLLLSNTDAIHFSWISERYTILRPFDHCVLSFELDARKPEPAIYREAIARAGCPAGKIFFTDDRPANVEGARQAGIDAVQFESVPQLELELKSRGVK